MNGTAGTGDFAPMRTCEFENLLREASRQLVSFVSEADRERIIHCTNTPGVLQSSALLNPIALNPEKLRQQLSDILRIDQDGSGIAGFQNTLEAILEYSVNTTAPGFIDKLYSAPVPPGIAAELILAVLNTNVHVYKVSPVLTLVEKFVTKRLAAAFGLRGSRAGGISEQGGSASNRTSIIVARNSLFPETKVDGNFAGGRRLVMFTSADGHYSIEKAAQALGFGSSAVVIVPTDSAGRMRSDVLEQSIVQARAQGKTPFYINATAGTTVLGSFDPFPEISRISLKYRCWLHIDGAWGGSFALSSRKDLQSKLIGSHLADSIAINPHKMLGIPLTCSFLLTRDLRLFQNAMTLRAGYLFHDAEEDDEPGESNAVPDDSRGTEHLPPLPTENTQRSLYDLRDVEDASWAEPDDLADMTAQCGRRGDSLKFFMSWQYYGMSGYAKMIENAYDIAVNLSRLIDSKEDLTLVLGSGSTPSCLQVCFFYTPNGKFVFGSQNVDDAVIIPPSDSLKGRMTAEEIGKRNSRVTSRITKALIPRGFMIDLAPALPGQEDRGAFLRAVVNISMIWETAERLVDEVLAVGKIVVEDLTKPLA